jgi:hypothetical protein
MQIKQLIIAIVLVIVTAVAVNEYHEYTAFQKLRSELMVGDCELRDGYTVCSQVTDLYVGPPR